MLKRILTFLIISLPLVCIASGASMDGLKGRIGNSELLPPPIPLANMSVSVVPALICPGDSAVIELGTSQIGVRYQLLDSITSLPIGAPKMGTGGVLQISTGPVFSTTSYRVFATDTNDNSTATLINLATLVVRFVPGVGIIPQEICLNDTSRPVFTGQSLDFDNVNDFVSIPHDPALMPTTEITVEAWVKARSWATGGAADPVVSKMDLVSAGGSAGYDLRFGFSGIPQFVIGEPGGNQFPAATSSGALATGIWHHIAGTYDGTFVRLYINGVLASTSVGTAMGIGATTQDVTIGTNTFIPGRFFDGEIDEVRIWNLALDANQIATRMSQPLGGNETGLIAYYDFNYAGNGTQLIDLGPNGFNGVLTNMDPLADWTAPGVFAPSSGTFFWDLGNATTSTQAAPATVYATPGIYTISGTGTDANGCVETDSSFVAINPLPVVNLGPDISYCGGPPLTLDAGNPTAVSFLWSTSAVTQTISVNTPGLYDVTVTDTNSCVASDTIEILSATAQMVNLGPDTSICQGQSLILRAGANWSSFLWSTAATVDSIVVTAPGTYFVDVVDSLNCTASDTIVITTLPSPLVNLGPDTTYCSGPGILLDAGNPGASYLWSTNAATQTVTISTPGQYSVIVTDANMCTGVDTVNVFSSGGQLINLGPDTTLCQGDSLVLDAGQNWASYLWSTADTVQSITVGAAGTYFAAVLDTLGCPGADTITVSLAPLPLVNLGVDTTICEGSPIVLDAGNPGASYLWSDNSTAQQLTVNQAGTYGVTVTNASQCNSSDTIVVNYFPANPFSLGADTVLCFGASLTLDVSGAGVAQTWSTGATTPTIVVAAADTIWVDVTDLNSCVSRDSIIVRYSAPPAVSISGLNPTYCENDSAVQLTGIPGGGIFAGPGVSGATFDPSALVAPDTVSVIYAVAPPNLCEGRDTLQVVLHPVTIPTLFGLDPEYCADAGPVTLAGQPAGGLFSGPGTAGTTFQPGQAGVGAHSIAYAYTNADGCTGQTTETTTVLALPQPSFVGLEAAYCELAGQVNLQGNPAGGIFSGPGVAGAIFEPSVAGVAAGHILEYRFTDGNGCTGTTQATLEVSASAGVADAGADQDLYLDNQTQLAATAPMNGTGTWTLLQGAAEILASADPSTTLSNVQEGENILVWTIQNGACSDAAQVRISKRAFEEKRGFSPNNDGKNDFFVIEGLERFPNSTMIIRSRWGETVLEDNNYTNDWTGELRPGSPLPDDTYFFELQVSNGTRYKGFVVLRR